MARRTPIFVSYRRDAAGGHAGRLHDTLVSRLGAGSVFIDQQRIQPGAVFPEVLRQALREARSMLVVITPGWAGPVGNGDAAMRRLWQPGDWVRLEVEAALQRGIPVLPVLVGRAPIPATVELPPSLRALAERQAIDLRDESWDSDVERLLSALGLPPRPPTTRGPGEVAASARTVAAIAGTALAILAIVTAALSLFSDPTPTRTAQDPNRLTTLDPSAEQIERLTAGSSLNVFQVRRFFELARQQGVAPAEVQTRFEQWRHLAREFEGPHHHRELNPRVDDALREAWAPFVRGDLEASLAKLTAAEAGLPPAVRSPPDRLALATVRWRQAVVHGLLGRPDAAVQGLHQASEVAQGELAWYAEPALSLAGRLLLGQGRVAEALGDFRRAEALLAGREKRLDNQARLVAEHADLLDASGQAAHGLAWRRRAEAVFDRHGDPTDNAARANAKALVQALDAAGQTAEAAALRNRYTLP